MEVQEDAVRYIGCDRPFILWCLQKTKIINPFYLWFYYYQLNKYKRLCRWINSQEQYVDLKCLKRF